MDEGKLLSGAHRPLMASGVSVRPPCILFQTSCLHPQPGQAKKPRLSKAITDDEDDEDEEEASVSNTFSQRLTRFKKSPAKKSRFVHLFNHFVLFILCCRQTTLQSILRRRRLYCAR